ncbi:MAG: acetyl-CoA carboxylase, carboxyltransferase subunit beta [Candidatus Brocadiales bacterium]|nr:acetyl-CoA carboxylase, carboxyltransferase subunit beta [Candidatus Brocadiales bacterium]
MPDGLWMRCDGCKNLVYKKNVEERMHVCPECNYHFRIFSRDRLNLLLDENSLEEMWANMQSCDPLNFKDRVTYPERVASEQEKTGLKEAAIVGKGKINGKEVMIGITDPSFIMGSMGSVVGEKITRITEKASELKLPLILISGSGGGARMHEGVFSLMQMAKTSAAIAKFREAGGLYISILTDPSLGGVMASFASQADIIIAEPKALIGFAGPRVIQETIKRTLPSGFQTAEFLLEHGFLDMIVHRQDMRKEISRLIDYLQ